LGGPASTTLHAAAGRGVCMHSPQALPPGIALPGKGTMLKLPAHNRYDYSSIEKRRDFNWPGGKRLAFYVALNVEQFAFLSGRGADPTQRGGPQTQRNYA